MVCGSVTSCFLITRIALNGLISRSHSESRLHCGSLRSRPMQDCHCLLPTRLGHALPAGTCKPGLWPSTASMTAFATSVFSPASDNRLRVRARKATVNLVYRERSTAVSDGRDMICVLYGPGSTHATRIPNCSTFNRQGFNNSLYRCLAGDVDAHPRAGTRAFNDPTATMPPCPCGLMAATALAGRDALCPRLGCVQLPAVREAARGLDRQATPSGSLCCRPGRPMVRAETAVRPRNDHRVHVLKPRSSGCWKRYHDPIA